MKFFKFTALFLFVAIMFVSCDKKDEPSKEEIEKMENQFKEFASQLESKIKGIDTSLNLAYFEASINSKPENWEKVENLDMKRNEILSNKQDFQKLKEFKESGLIKDHLQNRRLNVLYNTYLGNQLDTALLNEMSKLFTKIENKYTEYRAEVDGEKLSDNDVEEVLKTSTDNERLEKVWKAHKDIGPVVKDDILQLVKLRNKAAKELGFDNYHQMSLQLSEQDPEEIEALFDKLDTLTRDAFAEVKQDIDTYLANLYGISEEELQPWHYQNRYFQEAPKIYDVDLDTYYKDKNIEELTQKYYDSIGLDIHDMLQKSDLYERENKNQHAYCIDIDRDKKDIRVLCNIKPSYSWMNTMLHEFGHAVYEKYLDDDLPWTLKEPAHIFTTEAVAMFFGRFSANAHWMHDMIGISEEEMMEIDDITSKIRRLEQLVFSRWSQVMYRFEKSMYENPDQDLNKLWWDLVEKYQMVEKPEGRDMPDWATKIHIATSPCYYHNYLMGELLASQMYHYINTKVLNNEPGTSHSFVGKDIVGDYFKTNIFAPGKKFYWNEMIENATGEKLTPKYYANEFVE